MTFTFNPPSNLAKSSHTATFTLSSYMSQNTLNYNIIIKNHLPHLVSAITPDPIVMKPTKNYQITLPGFADGDGDYVSV